MLCMCRKHAQYFWQNTFFVTIQFAHLTFLLLTIKLLLCCYSACVTVCVTVCSCNMSSTSQRRVATNRKLAAAMKEEEEEGIQGSDCYCSALLIVTEWVCVCVCVCECMCMCVCVCVSVCECMCVCHTWTSYPSNPRLMHCTTLGRNL